MSFGISAATWAMVGAAVGAGVSIYNGQQAAKNQKSAMEQAKQAAANQEQLAQQEMNRANQKRPDTMSLLSAAQQAGKAGPSGTMLTGAQGINAGALPLGKSTLLGQ